MQKIIQLPHMFRPRPYQLNMMRAADLKDEKGNQKYRYFVLVWHRRAGKDKTAWNTLIKKSQGRKGLYFYFLPTYGQAKKILWDGIDKDGLRVMDHIPKDLINGKPNETEMQVPLINGSIIQLVSAENYDHLVGANPLGLVFSEYSIMTKSAWDHFRPILDENGGWVIFIYTPRGKNHGHKLYEMALENPEWFCELLTIENTTDHDGNPIMTAEDVEKQIASGMSRELAMQEYYCSFEGSMQGAYYSDQLLLAEEQERIGRVPWDTKLQVDTFWDIGRDGTAIWFAQCVGQEIRLIDYYEERGKGLPHYIKIIKEKPYAYGAHYGPHDIGVDEWGIDRTRWETARDLGVVFYIVPKISKEDGINAVRVLFPKMYFNRQTCVKGISALNSYRKLWNEKLQEFGKEPVHDWASHGADALRVLGVAYRERAREPERTQIRAASSYDPFGSQEESVYEEYSLFN